MRAREEAYRADKGLCSGRFDGPDAGEALKPRIRKDVDGDIALHLRVEQSGHSK